MSPEQVAEIREQLRELRRELGEVVTLQREANGRLGKIEARVFDLEIWRARLQGAAATSRVVWLLAGGAVTGIIIEIVRNT
jgi:hypothetical protein